MEFGAELSDIYGDLYELEVLKAKKNANMMNSTAAKCIENAHIFTAIVYKKEDPEDKFEYLSSMLNLELSSASKLTKFITSDLPELIEKTKEALNIYIELKKYCEEYVKWKKLAKFEDIENEQVV